MTLPGVEGGSGLGQAVGEHLYSMVALVYSRRSGVLIPLKVTQEYLVHETI